MAYTVQELADMAEAERIVAALDAAPAKPERSAAERREHGERCLARSRRYMGRAATWCQRAVAMRQPYEAGHWAARAAHEAGYQVWVQAKIDGAPSLAPRSNRLPNPWTDTCRTTRPHNLATAHDGSDL